MNSDNLPEALFNYHDPDLLRLIESNLSDIIFIFDPHGDCRYASSAVKPILGYSPADFIGAPPDKYCHPDDAARVRKIFARSAAGEKKSRRAKTRLEYRHLRKNGRHIWLQGRIISLAGPDDRQAELLLLARDITDQKRLEQLLRADPKPENLKAYKQLTSVIKGWIWDWDLVNNRIYDIRLGNALTGCQKEETTNFRQYRNFIHPADLTAVEKVLQKILTGNRKKFAIEYRLQRKNGSYYWLFSKGRAICAPNGKPVRLKGISLDITDRKQREEILLENQLKLKEFARAVPDVSFIIDEDGRYIEQFGNENFFPRDLKGRLISDVFTPADTQFFLSELRQTLDLGIPRYAVREITLGPEKRLIERRTAPMSYLANGKRTVVSVWIDITERQKAEKMRQLSYELRRRSDFINDMLTGKRKIDANNRYFAKKLELDLDASFFALVISSNFEFDHTGNLVTENNAIQKLKNGLLNKLSDLPNLITWYCRMGIGILCYTDSKDWTECKHYASHIKAKLLEPAPDLTLYIGVSEIATGFAGLKKVYRQALNAALAARCQTREPAAIIHYREAGIFQFLPDALEKESAGEYIEKNIGPLICYDREKGTDFLATLEELLKPSSVREKAAVLHLHPKTILFRQRRIEEILHVNLKLEDTRLALAIAIKLEKLNQL